MQCNLQTRYKKMTLFSLEKNDFLNEELHKETTLMW